MIELLFYKRIETSRSSIFYSLINYHDSILGFGRKHYEGHIRKIKVINLDNKFNNVSEHQDNLSGEDPRCFYHQDKLYIVDNYCNDNHLIDYASGERIRIPLSGKNFSFISHNNTLYIIHTMVPLRLYKFDTDQKILTKIYSSQQNPNKEYRGGTPGYYKEKNIYYGFGHRTYQSNQGLTHDIYYWEINFDQFPPALTISNLVQPVNSKTITDPTSVIRVEDQDYLVTAESDYPWSREQDYITNVYTIEYIPDPIIIIPIPDKPKKTWKSYFWSLFHSKSS